MYFTIAVGVGLVVLALVAIIVVFYVALSAPVDEADDPSVPKYQYFSERIGRTGRWKRKGQHRDDPGSSDLQG